MTRIEFPMVGTVLCEILPEKGTLNDRITRKVYVLVESDIKNRIICKKVWEFHEGESRHKNDQTCILLELWNKSREN